MLSRLHLEHGSLAAFSGEYEKMMFSITGRASNDPFPAFVCLEVRHLVVCPTQLEAEDGLKVFAFEKDSAF